MITVLCGRVAAGKTALAETLHRETGAAVLSCDDLMLTVFDGCLGGAHDRTAMKCLTYLFSLAVQLDGLGVDAVVDYGFWLRAERLDRMDAKFELPGPDEPLERFDNTPERKL